MPKFVFRWMISTGGTKFLRHGKSPNRRVQDGIKYPLLCSECETKTSKIENIFRQNVFMPSVNSSVIPRKMGKAEFDFVALLHLRVQSYLSREGNIDKLSESEIELLSFGIDRIGEYLNDEIHAPSPIRFFLVPFGLGEVNSLQGMPSNWHRYIRRHTEIDIISAESENLFGSYFKIGPWVSFCLLKNNGQPWIGGEVTRAKRKSDRRSVFPPAMLEYLQERAINAQRIMRSLSPKQRERVQEAVLQGDLLTNGRQLFEAIMADYDSFGEEAFY